jgi:hypothetical protein
MRTFDNEWIFKAFENHASFFTKRMFGGLAAYLFGRQMLVLVEIRPVIHPMLLQALY